MVIKYLLLTFSALINLLKFILSNETGLVKKHDIFHLANKVSLSLIGLWYGLGISACGMDLESRLIGLWYGLGIQSYRPVVWTWNPVLSACGMYFESSLIGLWYVL